MPITFIKIDTGSQVQDSHLNHSSHLPPGSLTYGGGLQDIIDVLIANHHHAHPLLLTNKFGDASAISAGSPEAIWPLTGAVPSNYRYTGGFDFPASGLVNKINQSKLAFFLLNRVSGGDVGNTSLTSFNLYNPGVLSTFSVDTQAPNHFYYTGVKTPSAKNVYGFNDRTLFTGPIPPSGIRLSGDVGGNNTFEDHVKDTSIHLNVIEPPTPTSDNDHLMAGYGFLNVYDLPSGNLDLDLTGDVKRTPQEGFKDDFYFDLFDEGDETLNQIIDGTGDISHPMLYEEAVYLHNNGKVRKYKLLKGHPDDVQLCKERAAKAPMDSLFCGGGPGNKSVFFSPTEQAYVGTINTALDTYWIDNLANIKRNREWKGGEYDEYAEYMLSQGLGYQPRKGLSRHV